MRANHSTSAVRCCKSLAGLFLDDLKRNGATDPDPEQLRLLAECYTATGDRCDRDALILALAFPTCKLARGGRYRHLKDDLLSVAQLALVVAAERGLGLDEIRCHVEREIRKAIREASNFLLSPSGRRSREKKGKADLGPVFLPLDFDPAVTPDDHLIFQEFLASLSDRDRTLLTLRAEGWEIDEISPRIGRKKTWIYERLHKLGQLAPGFQEFLASLSDQKKTILDLLAWGRSIDDIIIIFYLNKTCIYKRLQTPQRGGLF